MDLIKSSLKQAKIAFGSNLVVDAVVLEHLNCNPENLQKLKDFQKYLLKVGSNLNVELIYNEFHPKADEVEALIRICSKQFDLKAEKQILKLISHMEFSEEAANLLEKLANDSDDIVRCEAAKFAGRLNDPEISVALIEKLIQSKNEDVRHSAASSAGYVKNSMLAANLVEKLLQNTEMKIRENAAESVSNIKDTKIREALIKKLSNDVNAEIRCVSSQILHRVEDPELFEALLMKNSMDSVFEVREYAIYSIADFKSCLVQNNSSLYDSIIENAIKSPELKIKRAAACVLGKISNSKKAIAIIDEIIKNEDVYTAGCALGSLGFIEDADLIISFVDKLFKTSNNEIKLYFDQMFKFNLQARVHDHIIELLAQEKDSEIKKIAAFEAGSMGDSKKSVELIERFLNDENSKVREYASNSIAFIKDYKIRDAFINKYIQSNDLSIRIGIVDAVNVICYKNSEYAKCLAEILLNDEDHYIQEEAKYILDKIKADSQISYYSLRINDGNKILGQKSISSKIFGENDVLESFIKACNAIFENLN